MAQKVIQKDAYELQLLKDSCRVLKEIAATAPVNLSRLAKTTGLTTNKTFRILTTLVHTGFVDKREDGYCFGHDMAVNYARYIHRLQNTHQEIGQKLTELKEL